MRDTKKKIAAAVAIVDGNGLVEICSILQGENTYSRSQPVILHFDTRHNEIIVEIQNRVWLEDKTWEQTSRIFRFAIGNGWITVRDHNWKPIMHLFPAKTMAAADREARKWSERNQSELARAA